MNEDFRRITGENRVRMVIGLVYQPNDPLNLLGSFGKSAAYRVLSAIIPTSTSNSSPRHDAIGLIDDHQPQALPDFLSSGGAQVDTRQEIVQLDAACW